MKPAVSTALLFVGYKSVHIELGLLGVVGAGRRVRTAAVSEELRVTEGLPLHLALELSSAATSLDVVYHHVNDRVVFLGLIQMLPQLRYKVACVNARGLLLSAHDLQTSELLAHDLVNRDHPFEALYVETLNLTTDQGEELTLRSRLMTGY